MLYDIVVNQSKKHMKITWTDEIYMRFLLDYFKIIQLKHTKHKKEVLIPFETIDTLDKHKPYFPYMTVSDICFHLAKQLNQIHSSGYIVQSFSMKDIHCLDNAYYFFTNTSQFIPTEETNITKEDNYYDFGDFLVKCLLNKDVGRQQVETVLEPFYYTDLYWCILRCMDKEPTMRSLFYVQVN